MLAHIHKVTGFDVRQYRPSTLQRRLNWRLLQTSSKDYREYLALLKKNESENYSFINTFLIHVSEFFRDREVFNYLQKRVLPEILRRAAAEPEKHLRVWSIACSRGQEPYSLAMILEELRQEMSEDVTISVLATDVSHPILQQAKKGSYSKSEMRPIPQKYKKKYLRPDGNNAFKIEERIWKMVRFRQHDLLKDKIPGRFHLVLCRNILIFITARQQARLFRKIHAALKEGGILVLGKSESLRDERLFSSLSSQNHIYKRIP